jgi:signal transduction histidine kinase
VKPSELAGGIAIEIAKELTDPVRALRDRLGLVVDHLERHFATSTGPSPYPWRSLQVLRQDLSSAYLEATELARRIEELDRALGDGTPEWFDLAAAVDLALRLAGHHLGTTIELLFDLGSVPPARGVSGPLALLVAQLVAVSAASARAVAGSSLSVRVTADDGWGVVTIADNGGGSDRAAELGELARAIVTPWGGSAEAASSEQGCAFEIRLMTKPA